MSLAKGKIIKNTVGLITEIARIVNGLINKSDTKDERDRKIAENISITQNIYPVIIGRANGEDLETLVDPARIVSDSSRITKQEDINASTGRAYEPWLRDE